jgi:thioredoxin-like negative regulator of GroEL
MIERLLAADAALAEGELAAASRLFAQVAEADPRNAIAVVGLARIAMREGRTEEARGLLARALDIDPEEAAAQRLIRELSVSTPAPVPTLEPARASEASLAPAAPLASEPVPAPAPVPPPPPVAPRRPSLLDRLRAWLEGQGRRA